MVIKVKGITGILSVFRLNPNNRIINSAKPIISQMVPNIKVMMKIRIRLTTIAK